MDKFKIKEKKETFVTFYIKADCKRFNKEFYSELIENNKLIFKFNLFEGITGIQGEIALGILPSDVDTEDSWEANRIAHTWDWYTVFNFTIKINNDPENIFSFQIFNIDNSLIELNPYEIQFEFDLIKYEINQDAFNGKLFMEIEDEIEYYNTVIENLMKIFVLEFNAELIDKPLDLI